MEARVTLRPGAKGTKKLTEEFGDRLICVRYRYDLEKKRRFKTVEIVVDEAPWTPTRNASQQPTESPQEIVGVRIAFAEKDLRYQARMAEGRWDRELRLWLLPIGIARVLGLQDRVVRLLVNAQGDGKRQPAPPLIDKPARPPGTEKSLPIYKPTDKPKPGAVSQLPTRRIDS